MQNHMTCGTVVLTLGLTEIANLCSFPMDGSLLHMHQGCEVLYKLHSPFRVTEEVGDEGCCC